jgi:hypothetical protein
MGVLRRQSRRSLRCMLGMHRFRDAAGLPKPDWYSLIRPRTYSCTRCLESVTLYPSGGHDEQ